jgi:hypothetical protein
MLAAYSAGEQIVGRATIETVADNLDLLPRREALIEAESAAGDAPQSTVIRPEAQDEMRIGEERRESIKPRTFTETFNVEDALAHRPMNGNGKGSPAANGNGHAANNGNGNGHVVEKAPVPVTNGYPDGRGLEFEEYTDDEVSLELEELIQSFDKF